MTKVLGTTLLIGSLVLLASGSASADACATDFNGDGVTNEADFEIFKSQFGNNEDWGDFAPAFDLNDDGEIDLLDFNIYISCTN